MSGETDNLPLHGSEAFQLLAMARLLTDAFGRRVSRVGLSAEEGLVVAAVLEAPGRPGDSFGVGAADMVERLVAEGLLRRDDSGALWPAAAAEPLRPLLTAVADRIDAVATRNLDPATRQAAFYLMARMAENLRSDGPPRAATA